MKNTGQPCQPFVASPRQPPYTPWITDVRTIDAGLRGLNINGNGSRGRPENASKPTRPHETVMMSGGAQKPPKARRRGFWKSLCCMIPGGHDDDDDVAMALRSQPPKKMVAASSHPPTHRHRRWPLPNLPPHLSPDVRDSLRQELCKPVSAADETGYIYIYALAHPTHCASPGRTSTIIFKIGRTSNVIRRMNQWQRQCGYTPQLLRWYWVGSPCVRRVERLIHLELRAIQVKWRCKMCHQQHREWFEVEDSLAGFESVDKCIQRWVRWGGMGRHSMGPYRIEDGKADRKAVVATDLPQAQQRRPKALIPVNGTARNYRNGRWGRK